MQKATSLKDTIGEYMTNWHKTETDLKYTAEAVKSKISIEHAPGKPTEGNRIAAKEKAYLDAIANWTTARQMYELLEIKYEVIKDIAFQSWCIFDSWNKRARGE